MLINYTTMGKELQEVADMITGNIIGCSKDVLTANEVAKYMGISMSHLNKLTMRKEIPYYKPTGRKRYFNRKEIEAWLQTNRASTDREIADRAQRYCMQH